MIKYYVSDIRKSGKGMNKNHDLTDCTAILFKYMSSTYCIFTSRGINYCIRNAFHDVTLS